MRLYLIRHAHAGQRLPGGRDRYRPLSSEGRDRADALAELFTGVAVDRLLASPATRCLQTVESLSRVTGIPIDEEPGLFEGADTARTLADLEELDGQGQVVACSHGDVIPGLLEQLGRSGVPLTGRGCELGSVWIVERADGHWTTARYINPRASSLDG